MYRNRDGGQNTTENTKVWIKKHVGDNLWIIMLALKIIIALANT